MKKNKIIVLCATLVLCVGLICACSKKKENKAVNDNASDKKYSVVCTIFPQYDWVKQVIQGVDDQYDLTLLLDQGVDLHSYQPTADDIAKISDCDLFIYVGGESDGWVDDALKEAANKEMKVINLLDVLGDTVKEEEVVEGMQGEEEEEEGEEEGPEYDEHVWLSLKNAEVITKAISQSLSEIDSDNKAKYEENCNTYVTKLTDLDKKYTDMVASAKNNTIVMADRFPFRYMVEDYKLNYYAAFVGCSAETEASFETITFLANKVDELHLTNLCVIENADHKIADSVKNVTKDKNQEILVLDSLQSVTSKDIESGTTYLSVMEENFETLKKVLN